MLAKIWTEMGRGVNILVGFVRKEVGFAYTTVGNVGSALLGALLWLTMATLLEVGDYGAVNYYIALATVPATAGLMGLNTTVTTYLAKDDHDVVYQADSLVLLSGLVLALIASMFQWYSSVMILAIMFFGMSSAELLGRKKYGEYAFINIFFRVVQIISTIILYFRFGVLGFLLGYLVGLLAFSYRFFICLRRFDLRIGFSKKKISFTLHSFGLSLVQSLSGSLDKIIIGMLFGFYILGIYQLSFQFLMFLNIIPGSLYSYLLPEESSGSETKIVKALGLTLAFVAASLTYFLAPYVVGNFFSNFVDGIEVIRTMCMAVVPATVVSILNARFLGSEHSRDALMGGSIYLASLILFFLAFGEIMGILGLALSVVLATCLQAGFLWFRISRISQ